MRVLICLTAPLGHHIALTGEFIMLGAEINMLNWGATGLGINH
jgi:hypothetical protein